MKQLLMIFTIGLIFLDVITAQEINNAPNPELQKAYAELPLSPEGSRAVGDDCTNPIIINIPGDLPYNATNQTNCGRGNTYSTSCLGSYDGGEDIIYQLNVTATTVVTIKMNPNGTTWTGIYLSATCGNSATCIATVSNSGSTERVIANQTLTAGNSYYVMVDTWPTPNCIPNFTLNITAPLPNPAQFTATPLNTSQISLAFTPNAANNNVVIVHNSTGTFTTPAGTPSVGGSLAGGTVLYIGTSSPQIHGSLAPGTRVYYKAFSYNGTEYSSGLIANALTLLSNPTACGLNLAVADNGCASNNYLEVPVQVTGAPGTQLGTDVLFSSLSLIITHTYDSDLDFYLISPSGVMVEVSTDNGSGGDNFGATAGCPSQVTKFTMDATTSVTAGTAPFIGEYLPEGNFSTFYDGSNPNGIWKLRICDDASGDAGAVQYISLAFASPPNSGLEGYVYDSDNMPIAGATISRVGGASVTSDAGGYYLLAPLSSGAQDFVCSKPGYLDNEANLVIPGSGNLSHNFVLLQPKLGVVPESVFAVALPDGTAMVQMEVINNGSGSLDWSAFEFNSEGSCLYTIKLFDSYGDGWNGGKLDVRVNGGMVLNDITLTSGFGPVEFTFPVNTLNNITTEFIAGSYPWECYYKIYDSQMNEVWHAQGASGPPNINYGQLFAYCDVEWMSLSQNSGTVPPNGGSQTIMLHLEGAATPGSRAPGETYEAELLFASPVAYPFVTVPITFAVVDPGLAGAIDLKLYGIDPESGKFMLKWGLAPQRSMGVSEYMVFRNDVKIGATGQDNFKDNLPGPGLYCYEIYAVYDNGALAPASNEVCVQYPVPPGVPLSAWALILGGVLMAGYVVFMFRRKF